MAGSDGGLSRGLGAVLMSPSSGMPLPPAALADPRPRREAVDAAGFDAA
jgi:hypothetical protein